MYKRILVPVDGSDTSNRGLQEAILLAKDQRAKLRLIHVVDGYFVTLDLSGMVNAGELIDILQESGKAVLSSALASSGKEGVEAEPVMRETLSRRVAELIVKEAQDWSADLIVMGTHGRRGASHFFLGSDAEAVVRTGPVPTLLVRLQDSRNAETAQQAQVVMAL